MADCSKAEILKQKAVEAIDQYACDLRELSKKILEHPELCYEEKYAHDVLTKFLEGKGFNVTRHYTGLDTAFRAASTEGTGLKVGFICEYDALPGVGHACGHNLIAEAGAAAGIGKWYKSEV